jgi:hypothetical protein
MHIIAINPAVIPVAPIPCLIATISVAPVAVAGYLARFTSTEVSPLSAGG